MPFVLKICVFHKFWKTLSLQYCLSLSFSSCVSGNLIKHVLCLLFLSSEPLPFLLVSSLPMMHSGKFLQSEHLIHNIFSNLEFSMKNIHWAFKFKYCILILFSILEIQFGTFPNLLYYLYCLLLLTYILIPCYIFLIILHMVCLCSAFYDFITKALLLSFYGFYFN